MLHGTGIFTYMNGEKIDAAKGMYIASSISIPIFMYYFLVLKTSPNFDSYVKEP